jgi:MFS family permease
MLPTLLSFACINFFAAPVLVTLPFYATEYLGLGGQWYGYMMAAFGVGALTGYVLVAAKPVRGSARAVTLLGCLAIEAALIAAALAPLPAWSSVIFLFLVGVANGVVNVNIATLFQLATPRELRGRVNSLSHTVSGAAMPLGMALSGLAFDLSGQNVPLMFGGSAAAMFACVAAPLLFSKGFLRFLSTGDTRGAALP